MRKIMLDINGSIYYNGVKVNGGTMKSQAMVVRDAPAALVAGKFSKLLSSFLQGRNERTLRAYRLDLEDFRAFAGAADLDEASRLLFSRGQGEANSLALDYRADLLARGLAAATINRRLAALRSFVKVGRIIGLVPWSLEVQNMKAEAYRDTKGPGRPGVVLLLEEAQKRQGKKALRDRALLRLLHDLALRREEAVSLDVANVDLVAGTVSILGKGRTQRKTLSLPEPTKAALVEWLQERGDAPGPLFVNYDRAGKGERLTGTSLYRIIRDLGEKVGLRVRPHGLRHSAITEACKAAQANGMDLEEVLDFSRHANVKTLMIYRDRERNVQGRLAALVALQG